MESQGTQSWGQVFDFVKSKTCPHDCGIFKVAKFDVSLPSAVNASYVKHAFPPYNGGIVRHRQI